MLPVGSLILHAKHVLTTELSRIYTPGPGLCGLWVVGGGN